MISLICNHLVIMLLKSFIVMFLQGNAFCGAHTGDERQEPAGRDRPRSHQTPAGQRLIRRLDFLRKSRCRIQQHYSLNK